MVFDEIENIFNSYQARTVNGGEDSCAVLSTDAIYSELRNSVVQVAAMKIEVVTSVINDPSDIPRCELAMNHIIWCLS